MECFSLECYICSAYAVAILLTIYRPYRTMESFRPFHVTARHRSETASKMIVCVCGVGGGWGCGACYQMQHIQTDQ